MEHAMEWLDDDVTIIQVREELLALPEPPPLPIPLIRIKAGLRCTGIFALVAERRRN